MKNRLSRLLLQLSLIDDIGSTTILNMIEKIGAEQMLDLHQFSLLQLQALGFTPLKAQKIWVGLRDQSKLDQELKLIDKYQVKWVTLLDSNYPILLRHIPGAPIVLYWYGSLPSWPTRALAIVGSRQANLYGKQVISQIVPQLVQAEYAIVSGGALGADTMAHQAALDAGGVTLVVCGTGLAHTYPAQNKRLFAQVAANGGALVSSFAMNTAGLAGNFPARNRIISGLSQGCLVVQAAAQSGAKITAHFALEQGREVFVVPGQFGDPLSAGCHALAQEGAKIIHQIDDIFSEFGASKPALANIAPAPVSFDASKAKQLDNRVGTQASTRTCNIDNLIINLCRVPTSLDGLLGQVNLDINDLQMRLFDLQLQGQLKQNFAGLWEKG